MHSQHAGLLPENFRFFPDARTGSIAFVRRGHAPGFACGMPGGAVRSLMQERTSGIGSIGGQSLMHFGAQLANAVLGIATLSILTRAMSVEAFGTYSFVLSLIVFLSVFFDFGLGSAGMRLAAMSGNSEEIRRRLGAFFLLAAGLGIAFSVFLTIVSLVLPTFYSRETGTVLFAASFLGVVFPLQEACLAAGQGTNRIGLMSLFIILPRLFLLLFLLALPGTALLSPETAVLATLAGIGLALAGPIVAYRPRLAALRASMKELRGEVRDFGRQVYYGRIVDGLTNGVDRILISFFHGMKPVGWYSIALTMSSPVGMFSKSVAASMYQRFAKADRIPKSVLYLNAAWCTAGAAILYVVCMLLIPVLFTDKYAPSIAVLPLIVIATGLAGLNQPFHTFFAAQRQGSTIKVLSVTTSSVNVALNLVLVPAFAMTGAAIAMASSYGLNVAMNLYYYRRYLNQAPPGGGS